MMAFRTVAAFLYGVSIGVACIGLSTGVVFPWGGKELDINGMRSMLGQFQYAYFQIVQLNIYSRIIIKT